MAFADRHRSRNILAVCIIYGYFRYFTSSGVGYIEDTDQGPHGDDVTLPPNLEGNELFNLAAPTDSSGREIFADRKFRPIVVDGKPANYSALYYHQIEKAHTCDYKSLWPDPNVKPDCSAELWKKYYDKCDFFLDVGDWVNKDEGYPHADYVLEFCNLPKHSDLENNFMKVLGPKREKKILVLGDSNAHKFYQTFMDMVYNYTKLGYECHLVKREPEGKVADPTYYSNGTDLKPDEILINERTCSTCNSELNKCILPDNSPFTGQIPKEIEVEYLSMTLVTLDAITYKTKDGVKGGLTQQEFLIKYYLKNRYPDLLIIGATFTHDKRKRFEFVQKCMEHFINIIEEYIPKTSQIMWFDAAAHNGIKDNHCPVLFNIRIFDVEYVLRGNPKLEMLNHLYFYLLKPKLLAPNTNHFALFDLYHPSDLVMVGWALDCVHFKPKWYQSLISYMFGILATGVH